jgi:hypothetical protein
MTIVIQSEEPRVVARYDGIERTRAFLMRPSSRWALRSASH